jgi:hypothetical protein
MRQCSINGNGGSAPIRHVTPKVLPRQESNPPAAPRRHAAGAGPLSGRVAPDAHRAFRPARELAGRPAAADPPPLAGSGGCATRALTRFSWWLVHSNVLACLKVPAASSTVTGLRGSRPFPSGLGVARPRSEPRPFLSSRADARPSGPAQGPSAGHARIWLPSVSRGPVIPAWRVCAGPRRRASRVPAMTPPGVSRPAHQATAASPWHTTTRTTRR